MSPFATLLMPFKGKPAACAVKVINNNVFKIKYKNNSYLIIFSDGSEKLYEGFQFDGEMLCAQFDSKNKLKSCYGAKASKINYKGKKILDSVIRHKIDSVNNI